MLTRRTPIRSISDDRRQRLADAGITFIPNTLVSIERPSADPPRWARRLVAKRSGGVCEWSGCWARAVELHHRLNRKIGGRHGETAELINGPEWLLHCCRMHHNLVTSPVGLMRLVVIDRGWLLLEGQDAAVVLVLTRHDPDKLRLLRSGLLEVPDVCP